MERRIENRQPAHILTLFMLVQFTGILLLAYTSQSQVYQIISESAPPPQQINATLAFVGYIVAYIIIAAVVLIIIMRFYNGNFLFKALETYVLGVPVIIIASLVLSSAFPQANVLYTEGASFLIAALVVIARNLKPKYFMNFAVVCASIGLGVVIGLYGFLFTYLFMAVIAAYDYIAVFVTKHMITLAKGLQERNLAFLIGSYDTEVIPESYMSKDERAEYLKELKASKTKDPLVNKLLSEGKMPAVSAVALGAGDLALPLMLTTGVFVAFQSSFAAILTSLGAGLGLLATMYLLKRYKVALPAIPPLFAFMNLSLAIVVLLLQPARYLWALGFFLIFISVFAILLITLNNIGKKAREATLSVR